MNDAYGPLIAAMAKRSISAYLKNDWQLVISTQLGPPFPCGGNSFWITRKDDVWYLCTWGPVCYEVPKEADLAALCGDFVARGECAQTFVPVDLIHVFKLRQLEVEEYDTLFADVERRRMSGQGNHITEGDTNAFVVILESQLCGVIDVEKRTRLAEKTRQRLRLFLEACKRRIDRNVSNSNHMQEEVERKSLRSIEKTLLDVDRLMENIGRGGANAS